MIGQRYQQNLLSSTDVFSQWDTKSPDKMDISKPNIEPLEQESNRIEVKSQFTTALYHCRNINKFYFQVRHFDSDLFSKMHLVTQVRYRTGHLMYAARPYTTQLGDMKLYKNHRGKLYRCLIKDLYPENYQGVLKMRATIELIDKRLTLKSVYFHHLYDIPNIIEHIKGLDSELKEAKLYFGQPDNYHDEEVDDVFCKTIATSGMDKFEIKIEDDKDGVYHIDILSNGRSMLRYLRQRFPDKLSFSESKTKEPCKFETKLNGITNFTPTNRYKGPIVDISLSKSNRQQQNFFFDGALDYFKKKLNPIRISNSRSVMEPRFFSVKVISWSDPDSFYIIPNDRDYLLTHHKFIIDRERSLEFTKAFENPSKLIVSYELGQKCYFLNTQDIKLGKWLRGIIVEVPAYDKSGHLSCDSLNKETNKMESDDSSIWSSSSDDPDLVIYKVQSADYGFICTRSAVNLRQVPNEREFKHRGPWALRCKLFGVDPQSHIPSAENGAFSPTCLSIIDSWMRDRILDEGRSSSFYLLFRTNLVAIRDATPWPGPCAEISLFYRHQPVYRPEDCILPKPKKPYYECLNHFLVQRGVVSDYIMALGQRSNVDLDEFTINSLVKHEMI